MQMFGERASRAEFYYPPAPDPPESKKLPLAAVSLSKLSQFNPKKKSKPSDVELLSVY